MAEQPDETPVAPKGKWQDLSGVRRDIRLADWTRTQETIDQWTSLSETNRAKFLAKFRMMCLEGKLPHPEQIDDIGEDISEFKINGWRAAAFLEGRVWYVTHFFIKKAGKKWVRANRNIAVRSRSEHAERTAARKGK